MAVFTVHQPPRQTGDLLAHTERFVFVRDGFAWGAFVFGPLWLLRHRLWLALFGYVILVAALGLVLRALEGPAGVTALIGFLIALFLGIEASSLRRWGLERAGWRGAGVVVGDDLEAAERRFFHAFMGEQDAVRPAARSGSLGHATGTPEVIGLFPQPGVRA
jgi:hypothetical protein